MKRLFMVLAVVAFCVPVNAFALSSSIVVNARDPSSNSNFDANYDPNGGPVSASVTIGSTGSQAIANASADPATGKAGVQAYADAGYKASASANWDDSWTAFSGPGNAIIDCSVVPCNFYTNVTFHLDGILDPVLVYGTDTALYFAEELAAYYSFGDASGAHRLSISGAYDGDGTVSGPSMHAWIDGNDLTSYITFGNPDSNGDIPFTFDYTLTDWNFIGQSTFGSSMSMTAYVDNREESGSHNIDAFHTFTVAYQSLDSGVTWISDSGQTMPGPATSSVPEPSTMLLLGTGLTGLVAMRRFGKM